MCVDCVSTYPNCCCIQNWDENPAIHSKQLTDKFDYHNALIPNRTFSE